MVVARLALVLSFAAAIVPAAAWADDYVVVQSTDPAFSRGQAVDAGAVLPVGVGRTLTLMHASGDIVTLRGTAAGVSLPRRATNATDAERMAVLRFIIARAPSDARGGLRTRGLCPAAEGLTTLDEIVGAQKSGCTGQAATALEAFLSAHVGDRRED